MTLAEIRKRIERDTKTNSGAWGTTYDEMATAINNAQKRLETIIRTWTSSYAATDFSGSDVNTGTSVPKMNSRFHELLALWPIYDYAGPNVSRMGNNILTKIQILEDAAKTWYGNRKYRETSVTIAAPAVFTLDNHGWQTNDRVILETTGALPTGLSAETWYYVIYVTEHTFKLASSRDGSAITSTGTQSGTHFIGAEKQGRLRRNRTDSCE